MEVMQSKRIGFIGAHSTGKDTLSHHAMSFLKKKKHSCYYISEMAEKALMRGMDLNTPTGQMWMLGYQMKAEMEALQWNKREFILCNRSVIDNVPYCNRISNLFRSKIEDMVLHYIKLFPYDHLLLLRPFKKIENDGLRDMDRKDQLQIDQYFITFLQAYHIPYQELNAPTKGLRIKQMEKILRNVM